VQLKKRKGGRVSRALSAVSATLLVATAASCENSAVAQDFYGLDKSGRDNFGPGIAYSEFDSALLIYQEAGGRVEAIEPTANLAVHGARGQQLTLGAIADAVSGATPNGAVPSDRTQTFVTPLKAAGSSTTVTSASGGSTVIQLPPTPGQIASAALGRQYTTAPNTLPVDKGFHDNRAALSAGWSQPLGWVSEVGGGLGYSRESDYQSIIANARAAQNFNGDNTTISLDLNGEFDSSFPFGGVPTPLAAMNAQFKPVTTRHKTQLGFVLGVTEVVTRNWLMSFNYAYDSQKGYETDPYRVISLVDPTSGEPVSTLYESRPEQRQTQSVFWENKLAVGPTVTDLSFRYFKDNWGISSQTVEASERINLARAWYVEPNVRFYHQTAANFYQAYLVSNAALPAYASSDTRLSRFDALTYGMKIGFRLSGRSELYLRGDYYTQTGDGHPASAIGQLRSQDLFAGTKAAIVQVGYQWKFH
jgi:hypothetical protein